MVENRWGVWYCGPYEYESKEEAQRQLELARLDVPARLIFNNGDGWRDFEVGHRLGKPGLADDLTLLDKYAKTADPDIDDALVSVTSKLEQIEELLERRKKYVKTCQMHRQRLMDAGDTERASMWHLRAETTQREVSRLAKILYDDFDG